MNMLPHLGTSNIFRAVVRSDNWWLLQAHRDVTAQIMRIAERLQVADVDRWATGVLANVERGGAADGAQMLRAAQMEALGKQLASPTQPAALSVQEIRQLASARALMQPSATVQESRAPSGQPPPPPSASPRLTRARGEWAQALPVLFGTTLAPGGQLSSRAVANLNTAHLALAREVDLPPASMPRATAALKVLADHWTARIGREPQAFERARAAQDALTGAMAPLRVQAAQQRSLVQKTAEYDTTIDSIRVLEPNFDEARIVSTRVGDVTLSQLESSVPSRMSAESFAQLKLDVARRYLTEYQTRATADAASPATGATQSFIDALRPELRKSWDMQLIGGPPLKDVVASVARRGGELSIASVDLAVRNAKAIAPASYPKRSWEVVEGRFYEIRYDGFADFSSKLKEALHYTDQELPMQIRSADGNRRLDIYRHGSERRGTTIIDQRDGSAVPQPDGLASAVADAFGIKGTDYGALVVSYGSSSVVMADNPRIYTSPTDVVRQGIETPESRGSVSTRPLRRNMAERASTPAQRLAQLETDLASFPGSLDARRSASQPDDLARFTDLREAATRLRNAAPGSVGDRAGEIGAAVEDLSASDRHLRSYIDEGLLTSAAARDTLHTGSATMHDIVRIHGVPAGNDIPRTASALLRFVIEMWEAYKWDTGRGKKCFGEFDALPQARRVEIMSTPLRFMEWLKNSRADWHGMIDSINLS